MKRVFERGFHSNFFRVPTPSAVIKENKIQITSWPCKKTEYLHKKFCPRTAEFRLAEYQQSFQICYQDRIGAEVIGEL